MNNTRQDKLDELKQQIADNQHPQQSADRDERIAHAQKTAEAIIAELAAETAENSDNNS